MRTSHLSDRGQVLIIFVFAIVGLIAITGLAIDGGNIYSDRRHAQNAADTASLAAAVLRVNQERGMHLHTVPVSDCTDLSGSSGCGSLVKLAALDMAMTNGYDNNIVENTVEVYTPPIDGPYAGDADYIQVYISTNVTTWFAKILGIRELHNRVNAVALARYTPEQALYGGNSLVELNPHSDACYGDVYVGGSASMTLIGGGIFVNSDNPTCAFKETSACPTITMKDGAQLTGVGGPVLPPSGCSNMPPWHAATEQYPFPPEPIFGPGLIPPPACSGPLITSSGVWNASDSTYHFAPGHYQKLPPDKNTTLDPGVYCVDDVVKSVASTTMKGNGVFIYIQPGGSFYFNGGVIQLRAPGMDPAVAVTPELEPYRGYLMYVDFDPNWYNDPDYAAENCIINGGASNVFTGVIYAPYCDVTINGQSSSFGITAQVIGYTLSIDGTNSLTFTYDPGLMPKVPEVNRTGLFR